ncbi:MAG: SPFH domain-containing protein [Candidatus Acidoferrales bacterium]|nr:SPFH domain-containing protein [Candidatus Acidoferrales bacterium]
MLFLKYLLIAGCFGLFATVAGMVLYDIYLAYELDRLLRRHNQPAESLQLGEVPAPPPPVVSLRPRRRIRWSAAAKLSMIAAVSGLLGLSILVVPDGQAGVRISQLSGVRPGTLFAGTHLIVPLVDRVQFFDVRDRVFSTTALAVRNEKLEVLEVQAREGLSVGLEVTVRYRIDPSRLAFIQANVPQPVDSEIVEPTVVSAFHEIAPNYVVRDLFSTKREEFRSRATQLITTRLGGDGIVVKEVLLKKVELPEEYAKGLEDLLLKEQEDDRTSVDAEIEQKKVAIAQSQAEAAKAREVKRAEGDAQAQVIMAKAQSDAMQYTLPLKQKQIEQSRLEAEARKQTTIEDAEAAAQAKVIDSKAEQQRQGFLADSEANHIRVSAQADQDRQKLLADSEANRIRVTAQAEQEREKLRADSEANRIRLTAQAESEEMQLQAAALKVNPLLVQLTVAQRLSDRVQIMMVPNDGKFFFTNDVLKSAMASESGNLNARPNLKP